MSGATPTRLPSLAPLTSSQKASHLRLLQKIQQGDAEEAKSFRKTMADTTNSKRAMRSGNSAFGLRLQQEAIATSALSPSNETRRGTMPTPSNYPSPSFIENSPHRRSNSALGGATPSFPQQGAQRASSPSKRSQSAMEVSFLHGGTSPMKNIRAQSPPRVGDVGRLILAATTTNEILTAAQNTSISTTSPNTSFANNNGNSTNRHRRASSGLAVPPILPPSAASTAAITTLEPGIAIAVQQSSFDELAQHGVWTVDGTNSCHLTLGTIEAIYKAKVNDSITLRHGVGGGGRSTIEAPSSLADNASASDRLMRFVEVIASSCKGIYFDISGQGLGRTAVQLVVDALIADHGREEVIEKALLAAEEEEERKKRAQQQQNGIAGGSSAAIMSPATAKRSQLNLLSSVASGGGGGSSFAPITPEKAYAMHYDYPSYAVVDLSRNFPGERGGEIISRLLLENESVVSLSLKSMGLVNNPGTCKMFHTLAHRNCTLTCLDMSGIVGNPRNNLGGASGMAVGEMLKHNAVLTTLRLRDCGLDPFALTNLFNNAMTHVALSELDVSGNKIDKQSTCTALAAMLAFGACRLEKLLLEGCSICDSALKVISKGLNQDLHSLDADEATQNEAVALQSHHPLYAQTVAAKAAGSAPAGSGAANKGGSGASQTSSPTTNKPIVVNVGPRAGGFASISSNPQSRNDKSSNAQGSGAYASNSNATDIPYIPQIPASSNLRHFSVANNAFGFVGLMYLSQKLVRIPRLEVLNVSDNKLMGQGLDAEGMRQGNTIAAVDALLYVLAESVPTLQELNLINCGLVVMPTRIEQFMCKSLALRRLRLCRNPFGDFGARMLGEALLQRAYVLKSRYISSAMAGDVVVFTGANGGQSRGEGGGGTSAPAAAKATTTTTLSKFQRQNADNVDLHQDPFHLLSMQDCGVSIKGMLTFLQHVAQAPKVQITSNGLIIGFRTSTITPNEGGGSHPTGGGSGGPGGDDVRTDDDPNTPAAQGSEPQAVNLVFGGAVPTASTPIGPSLMLPAATSAFAQIPTSLLLLPKSLFAAEVIVPSGYHGFAVNTLKLTQPSWAKWGPDLIDLLCHTPCLEHTDLGRYSTDALARGLEEHKRKRIASSVPKFQQQVDLVKREESRLFEANDQIQDEIKRTEKAREMFKAGRDRQKAILTQLKTEIASMTDEIERQEEELEATNNQVGATEIYYKEKNETMAGELARMQRKIDTVVSMRKDIEAQNRQTQHRQKKHLDLIEQTQKLLDKGVLVLRRSFHDPEGLNSEDASIGVGTVPEPITSVVGARERSTSLIGGGAINRNAPDLGTGLSPVDLKILAMENDLKELEQETELNKGAALFFKRQLDELNRKIALLGGDGQSKKKRGSSASKKKDSKTESESKKTKSVVAKP